MSEPTFLKVAARPKWVGALVLALAIAAIFALLAQWQADRTFRYVPKTPTNQIMVSLESIAQSSSPFEAKQADRLVSVDATAMAGQCYVIGQRIQLDGTGGSKTGAWIARPAITSEGKLITLALGWFATQAEANFECERIANSAEISALQNFRGIYEPSEEARASSGRNFESLSIEQVINQPGLAENVDAFAGFIIVSKPENLGEAIVIGNNPGENVFNWLTAFYAIEWTLFAGFAVFLWGRLVKDEVIRQTSKGRIS